MANLLYFTRWFAGFFSGFFLLFSIFYEMHVHYLRLYNLPVCVREYFEAWRLIHYPEDWELANNGIARHRQVTIGTVYAIMLWATIRTIQMALSMTIPMSLHWRILYWDQMLFQNAIPQLNLIYVIITPFCVYFYYRFYFYRGQKKGQMETIWLSYQILYGEGDPRYTSSRCIMHVDAEKIRRIANKNIYWLQYWNLYMELAYVFYMFKIGYYISEHLEYFFTTFSGYLSLLVILLNGSIAFLYIYTLLIEYIQNNVVGLVSTMAIFLRMRQIDALLADISERKRRFKTEALYQFTKCHTLVLLDIFEANRLFGAILLLFIVGAVPTSAYQIVLLFSKHMSTMTAVNFVNLSLYQIGVVFGFHLAAAMYSYRIHRCSKSLSHLSASERPGQPIRSRFHLALYIEKFNVSKKYGMTYVSFGLVSFKSFFKFTLLYGELLMFSYRWAKRLQDSEMIQQVE